jgi:hypothetical protein
VYRHALIAKISPFLEGLRGVPDPGVAGRVLWTPLAASTAAVLMALDPGCPLGVRFEDALRCMRVDFSGRRRVGGTYNGLLKALERQQAGALPALKTHLRGRALAALARIPAIAGWTLLAVDGSKEDLPRTRSHEEFFGIADNGVQPQAFITSIVEAQTGLPWDWRIDRGRACEKNHLIEMAPGIPDGTLLLADGDFVGYPVWSALDSLGKRFLIRVGGNASLLRGLWPDAAIERRADIVHAWPVHHQRTAPPLRLRLIRAGSRKDPVWLLTNVLDPCRLSRRTAGEIYRRRWGVELFYRTLKRTLGYSRLRSRSGRRGRLELEWGMVAATIMAMLGVHALRRRRLDPRRLSPSALLRALRGALLRGAAEAPGALDRAVAGAVRDAYRRHRPKRSRSRPVTRNTPSPLRLKPPRVRAATPAERQLAHQLFPCHAA